MFAKLKKINAVLGLLTVLLLFSHAGYIAYCYSIMYFNETVHHIFAGSLMLVLMMHAVLGMSLVFLNADGTDLTLYPGYNKATIVQRISAAFIFPMLMLHLETFGIMNAAAEKGAAAAVIALIAVEILFFGTVFTHISVSFSRALISLGLLVSREKQSRLDKAMYIICAVSFVAAVTAVVRTQLIMYLV